MGLTDNPNWPEALGVAINRALREHGVDGVDENGNKVRSVSGEDFARSLGIPNDDDRSEAAWLVECYGVPLGAAIEAWMGSNGWAPAAGLALSIWKVGGRTEEPGALRQLARDLEQFRTRVIEPG